MELNGKCKEAFDEWYENTLSVKEGIYRNAKAMNCLSASMAYGVYIDFFDSVGLNILLTVEFDYGYIIAENRYEEIEEVKKWYDERHEAQEAAILKANEIFNNR